MSSSTIRTAGALGCTLCLTLQLLPLSAVMAQDPPPHTPTTEELRQRERGYNVDESRDYQGKSVSTVQGWYQGAVKWVKDLLKKIHLTPARLTLALGVLGTIYTLGKNKRLARWAVMAGLSYLLLIVGICAMVFDWPHWNK